LHEVTTGLIEEFNSNCLGITRILDLWGFASIFVQYADADEIVAIPLPQNTEESIIGGQSPMSLIRHIERERGDVPAGQMIPFLISSDTGLLYCGRPIKRIMMTAEKQRRIWEPKTRFFAYDEVHPNRAQRGIAIISDFSMDPARKGRLTLVISPDPENVSGRFARLAGQFEFFEAPVGSSD
jgi:hypothetical protein